MINDDSKKMIELSGQLDWRVRNGKFDDAIKSLNAMQFRLNRVREALQLFQKVEDKQ